MHTILSTIFAIHALSAGALATPPSIDGRSGAFGTIGQIANLKIKLWDSDDCMPSTIPDRILDLSWGVMRPTNNATQSFSISRELRNTEHLDWSVTTRSPPSAKRDGWEHIEPGCEQRIKSTDFNPIGNMLGPMCVPLGMVMEVSYPSGECAKCTDR